LFEISPWSAIIQTLQHTGAFRVELLLDTPSAPKIAQERKYLRNQGRGNFSGRFRWDLVSS